MARGPQKRNRVQAQKPHVASYNLKPSAKPKPKHLAHLTAANEGG